VVACSRRQRAEVKGVRRRRPRPAGPAPRAAEHHDPGDRPHL